MKKQFFLIAFICVCALETVALVVFAFYSPDVTQDTVAVNEVVQSVSENFYTLDEYVNSTSMDYTVSDTDGNILYRTKSGLSESLNEAIAHRDTVLDITVGDSAVGKVIIYNYGVLSLQSQKRTAVIVLVVAMAAECAICAVYAVYIHRTVVKPFGKLKSFAERVAGGNLDIPLEMDRRNLFGAFTESFDIMRSQLK